MIKKFGLDVREISNHDAIDFLKANTTKSDLKDIFIRDNDYWVASYVHGAPVCVIGASTKKYHVALDALFALPESRIGVHAVSCVHVILKRYDGMKIVSYARPASQRIIRFFGFETKGILSNGTAYMVRDRKEE